MEKLGVIPWMTTMALIPVPGTPSLFSYATLLLFPEQWHFQNGNIYISLQLVWSFLFYVSLKGHLASDYSWPI